MPLRLGTGQTSCEHYLREVGEPVLDQEWGEGGSEDSREERVLWAAGVQESTHILITGRGGSEC